MHNKTKEKIKLGNVVGKAMFENGKLVLPGKKKKTAEQLLEENPMSSQLKREITIIENEHKLQTAKPKQVGKKEVDSKTILSLLVKFKGITAYHDGTQNVVQCNKKTICWVADRKYGFAFSTWEKGGKNFKTIRVTNDKEMKEALNIIKNKGGIN